jgi:hypothetical protein
MVWADRAIEIDPCGENYFEKVRCYYEQKDWGGVWETCKITARCEKTAHYLSSEELWAWRLYDMQALSAHNLGDKAKAVKYGKLAVEGNPADLRLHNNMKFYEMGIENQV